MRLPWEKETVDFVKQQEEAAAKKVAEDQRLAAEASRQAEAEARAYMTNAGVESNTTTQPVADLHDGNQAVNETTGTVDEAHAPTDRNLNTPDEPVNSQPSKQPQQPAPERPLTPLEPSGQILASSQQFNAKPKSFFDPDAPKGFFAVIETNINRLAAAKTPEDFALAATEVALVIWLEFLSNACDHFRLEKERREKEYYDNVDAFDKAQGATPAHKDMAIWTAIITHPDMATYANQPITADMIRTAKKLYNEDEKLQGNINKIITSMTGREQRVGDIKKAVNHAFDVRFSENNTFEAIKNHSLKDPVVQKAFKLSGYERQMRDYHARAQHHRAAVRQNQDHRQTLNRVTRHQNNQNTAGHQTEHTM